MLCSKDVEKLNSLCVKFEKDVIEYVKNKYVEKGYVKDEINVKLDYSPQYNYEQKELTHFQKVLKFLGFDVVDVGLQNQQVIRLYRIAIEPSYTEPWVTFEVELSGLFFIHYSIPYETSFMWFTDKLKEKIS